MLEENQFITLTRYEIVHEIVDGFYQSTMKFVKKERYQIGAAICHLGGGAIGNGHYVCDERSQSSNRLIRHNDGAIDSIKKEDFGKLGYLLRLDKVKEVG